MRGHLARVVDVPRGGHRCVRSRRSAGVPGQADPRLPDHLDVLARWAVSSGDEHVGAVDLRKQHRGGLRTAPLPRDVPRGGDRGDRRVHRDSTRRDRAARRGLGRDRGCAWRLSRALSACAGAVAARLLLDLPRCPRGSSSAYGSSSSSRTRTPASPGRRTCSDSSRGRRSRYSRGGARPRTARGAPNLAVPPRGGRRRLVGG